MTATMGLAEAKDNLTRMTTGAGETGRPVMSMRNGEFRAMVNPAVVRRITDRNAAAPVGYMDEHADVFEEPAK
ncbi:MAG: hypothetical protein IJ087_07455 [Eggerthellaceae bacterium]|nr:hypothetical protein [Eggerthellaceae bacterium]